MPIYVDEPRKKKKQKLGDYPPPPPPHPPEEMLKSVFSYSAVKVQAPKSW